MLITRGLGTSTSTEVLPGSGYVAISDVKMETEEYGVLRVSGDNIKPAISTEDTSLEHVSQLHIESIRTSMTSTLVKPIITGTV